MRKTGYTFETDRTGMRFAVLLDDTDVIADTLEKRTFQKKPDGYHRLTVVKKREKDMEKDMEKIKISNEMDTSWMKFTDQLSGTGMTPDCIDCRPNIDGTLDFCPLPLAIKNLWLFKNRGEGNVIY